MTEKLFDEPCIDPIYIPDDRIVHKTCIEIIERLLKKNKQLETKLYKLENERSRTTDDK